MMKKCYIEFFPIVMYVHSMNPSQHRASRSFSKRLCEGIGPNIKKTIFWVIYLCSILLNAYVAKRKDDMLQAEVWAVCLGTRVSTSATSGWLTAPGSTTPPTAGAETQSALQGNRQYLHILHTCSVFIQSCAVKGSLSTNVKQLYFLRLTNLRLYTVDLIVTIPAATMPAPGLIRLEYDDAPLLPQVLPLFLL